tara:strand:+ start:1264 stop:1464 length:201 start_codon:yes stop_codon:yes gene_type:complete
MKIKRGSLVQVLPAKIGYYIVLERAKMRDDYVGLTTYWELHPLSSANFDYGGPMDEKYIEVVSEGR